MTNTNNLYQCAWIFSLVLLAHYAHCDDYCSYLVAEDGTEYNLQTITERGTINFPYLYSGLQRQLNISLCSNITPCRIDDIGTVGKVALCRLRGTELLPFGTFNPRGITPLNNGAGVEFKYSSKIGSFEYSSKTRLLCNYNYVGVQNYTVMYTDVTGFHYHLDIIIETEAACPVVTTISGGTVFMLCVLITSVLYIVVGILVNKFSFMKNGREVMPHVNFWTDLPFLVKDGAVFLVGKIRNRSRANPYEPVVEY